MRVVRMTVENCKSFKSETPISFDDSLNILVGPNGGGKSNTLDILTITLHKFFLWGYTTNEGRDAGVRWVDIQQKQPFDDVSKHLEKYTGQEAQQMKICLHLQVQSADIDNMRIVINNRPMLEGALSKFRNKPHQNLDFVNSWDAAIFHEGQEFKYEITNHSFQNPQNGTPEYVYLQYLQQLELFLLLSRHRQEIDIRPCLLYFSPYRGATAQDLQVSLSSESFYDILMQHFTATSRSQTSLIKIATLYFAEKLRKLETSAKEHGYQPTWDQDPEVELVTRYMDRLGYNWTLKLVDSNKNIYEILLQKDGREFHITQASSGEKEILNFLLGVFAFGVSGGLIIVDEPELHLHPTWQGLLRGLFLEMAILTKNQFVISTHSPVFLTPETLGNVRRVSKNTENATQVTQVASHEVENRRALLHIVNSHNNERMFFSDRVVLVEGIQDRLVFETLINHYRSATGITEIVEVLEVHGKGNFEKYVGFLDGLDVPTSIIADQDYLQNVHAGQLTDLFETRWKKIDSSVLREKKSTDRKALAEHLDKAVLEGDMKSLGEFWGYVKNRHTILKSVLTEHQTEALNNFLGELRSKNIFILREGEIEDYLPSEYTQLEQTIILLHEGFSEWLKTSATDHHLRALQEIAFQILGLPEDKRDELAKVC